MSRPRHRPAAVLQAALVVAAIMAGCIVERPYTSNHEAKPLSVTLTAAQSVAVFDISLDRSGLPRTANIYPYVLRLHDVDPRVRIASMVLADQGNDSALGTIATARNNGDLSVDLPSQGKLRLVVELTDPRPDDAVAVAGTLDIPFGYDGTPAPNAHVVVSGLDAPEMRGDAYEQTVRTVGPSRILDADHPFVLIPVRFALHGGRHADRGELASATKFELAADIPEGAASPTLYTSAGDGTAAAIAVTSAPMADCNVAVDAKCETPMILRWQWTGEVPRVDLRFEAVTTLVAYNAPVDSTVTTEFGDPLDIPPDARPITATQEGKLQVGGSDRATAWFRITLKNVPAATEPHVLEVPGVLLVTYSALGRDGTPNANAVVPLHFRDVTLFRSVQVPIPELLDLPADGVSRSVGIPIFSHCQPAKDCTLDFWLELFPPLADDVAPVTLTYRFDARVTAFTGESLSRETLLTIGPKPSDPP
jgi:hypothetical protein